MTSDELRQLLNVPLLPSDAGPHADDLRDVLGRIPDGWGRWIQCDRGWYDLIARTNAKLRYLHADYVVYQVKEKFGTLRYYWELPEASAKAEPLISIMHDVVDQAERRSASICERCGRHASGTRNHHGFYFTACFDCVPSDGDPRTRAAQLHT